MYSIQLTDIGLASIVSDESRIDDRYAGIEALSSSEGCSFRMAALSVLSLVVMAPMRRPNTMSMPSVVVTVRSSGYDHSNDYFM